MTEADFYLGVSQREPKFKIALRFCCCCFLPSVTNRCLGLKTHASRVDSWRRPEGLRSLGTRMSTDMVKYGGFMSSIVHERKHEHYDSSTLKPHTNAYTVCGRTTRVLRCKPQQQNERSSQLFKTQTAKNHV